jgi:hypothetical protein
MTDTVKIPRPLFCRRENDVDGRPTVDATGAHIQIKTRFSDTQELPQIYPAEDGIERVEKGGSRGG